MADRLLHVSIGPVQGFVAQARRTRDLWAGSFLLSWLAGQLMAATLRQDSRILFPVVGTEREPENPMLAAVLGRPLPREESPRIGSLPNRFKASVPGAFDPEAAAEETRRKWRELAECVWRRFVADAAGGGRDTRAIWDRQIEEFWDIQWVMDADPGDGSDSAWLDRRKNWRSHWPPEEGGDHCTTMGDRQELSGFVRSRERPAQDAFWGDVRRRTGRLDLRDDERLCAVALVKRLFPKLEPTELETTVGWNIGAANWPSTAYMAAAPWLAHVAADPERRTKLQEYVESVRDAVGPAIFGKLSGERTARLPGLSPLGAAADLDGNLFLEPALANPRATPLSDDARPLGEADAEDGPDAALRARLSSALRELGKVVGAARPFYALLSMDGDRLGKLLRESGEERISGALAAFVSRVPDIVRDNDGSTVYAGGDDVLAMLPVDRAIGCATALRRAYGSAFAGLAFEDAREEGASATASCAVVFAHYRNPLREVLALAREELDGTAKDGNGRDSLALAVILPGGVNHRWVARFGRAPEAIAALRAQSYPASFLYNLRRRYEDLIGGLDADERHAVVLAEHVKGAPPRTGDEQVRAEAAVNGLLAACTTQRGDDLPGAGETFRLDGAFVARFLAEICDFGRAAAPS